LELKPDPGRDEAARERNDAVISAAGPAIEGIPRAGTALPALAATTAPPSPPSPAVARKAKVAETIRVDSDRLDHLMNLAGELVINKARFVDIARGLEELFRGTSTPALAADIQDRLESLARRLERRPDTRQPEAGPVSEIAPDRWAVQVRRLREHVRAVFDELDRLRLGRERIKALNEAIHHLGRITDGLQKGVLDTRMVPIGPLFERFRRLIRDLGHASGKEILLRIEGEKTELDKRMIDELSDPLIHMVRNAVDHGLEDPQAREAAGKPRAGTISLQASHRGNSIVITVGDDGRGIDPERIRRKAVSRGWVDEADAAEIPERDLVSFIWRPGFSTAESVSEISGRGVGMDIVKNRIENLNGTVDVRSAPGQGTTFTIRLPLTLAIMSSLLVRIFEEIYALPLDHIDEIVQLTPDRIHLIQGRPAIEIREKIIALVSLEDIFRWGGEDHPCSHRRTGGHNGPPSSPALLAAVPPGGKLTVVVVQNGETTIGLLADELVGMQEVVLKSLDRNYRAIPGLSGASILGDGRVSLILDVDALIAMASRPRQAGRAGGSVELMHPRPTSHPDAEFQRVGPAV
jgi:two-component system chemotaxis sensor kinase CheA